MSWHYFSLSRAGHKNHLLAAAEELTDGRPSRHKDGSCRIVTAYGPTPEAARHNLDREIAMLPEWWFTE